jgi:D-sedoheptulose 7-phosphate isomerase
MRQIIETIFEEAEVSRKKFIEGAVDEIEEAANIILSSLRSGGKVLTFGNGGSAADAQHMASELVNKFGAWRKALPALSLSTDPSVVTSISNDAGYEEVFSRQIDAHGRAGDVAFGISTSGTSENVLLGMKKAADLGMDRVALVGRRGSPLEEFVEVAVSGGEGSTPRIQENHILVIHILCDLVDREFA